MSLHDTTINKNNLLYFNSDPLNFSVKEIMNFIIEQRIIAYNEFKQTNNSKTLEYFSRLLKSQNIIWVFIVKDNKILGLSCLDKIKYHIKYLFIDKSIQNSGYGKQLLDKILDNIPKSTEITVNVRSSNLKAIKFYLKYGFEIVNKISHKRYLMSLTII